MNDPDAFWANMLSRDSETIRATWENLTVDEKTAVYTHITRMVTEEDWAEPQRLSAQAALDALHDLVDPTE